MQPEYSHNSTPRDDSLEYPPGLKPPTPKPGATPPQGSRVPVRLPDIRPTYTMILLASIILVYLAGQVLTVKAQFIYGYPVRTAEDWLFIYGAKINSLILQQHQFYRLLTAMFLHGGLEHLFFNGYALYIIGRDVERLYGHARFLILYFLTGLTGSVASLALSQYASVGASGALFGLFAAEMVFLYQNRRLFGAMARSRLNTLFFLLVLNLAIGLVPGSNIDMWGHVGGFLSGVALSWVIGPIFRPELPTAGEPYVSLADDNPLRERMFVPFVWAAFLVLAVGLLVATRG